MNDREFNASIRETVDEECPELTRETDTSSAASQAFGRFRVVHQVGAGVLGPVFRAYDPDNDRTVAVKSFPLPLPPEQVAEFGAALHRLTQTPLAHPSIVTPLESGVEGSTAYLVQDYFVAESVDVALRQYGPAPVGDALRLVVQLAGALDFAAAAGVFHGALHARDILVAPAEVRLTGLGVAAALESVGQRITPRRPYAAPERLTPGPWGTPADVYSLAVVALELLTGRRVVMPAMGSVPDLNGIVAADPPGLYETIARALAERPEDRHPTALAFAAALKYALAGGPLEAPSGEALRPKKGRGRDRAPEPALPLDGEPTAAASPMSAALPASETLPPYLQGAMPAEPEPEPARPKTREPRARASKPAAPVEAAPPASPAIEPIEALHPTPRPEMMETPASEEKADAGEAVATALPEPPVAPTPAPLSSEPLAAASVEAEPHEEAPGPPSPSPGTEDVSDALVPPEPAPELAPPASPDSGVDFDDLDIRLAEIEPLTPAVEEPTVPSLDFDAEPPMTAPGTPSPSGAPLIPRDMPPDPETPRKGLRLTSVAALVLVGVLGGLLAGYFFASSKTATPNPASNATASGASTTPVPSVPSQVTESPVVPESGRGNAGAANAAKPPSSGAATVPPLPSPSSSPGSTSAATPDTGRGSARPGGAAPPPGNSTPSSASRAAKAPASSASDTSSARNRREKTRAAKRQEKARGATAPTRAPAAASTRPGTRGETFEGGLVVISRPDGARVLVDGHAVGTTPLTMKALSAGSHAVRLEKDGYAPWSASVQVVAGQQNRVTASLDLRR